MSPPKADEPIESKIVLINFLSPPFVLQLDNRSSHALVSIIPESRRISLPNPVLLAKAVKNKVEIECMKRAHVIIPMINLPTLID